MAWPPSEALPLVTPSAKRRDRRRSPRSSADGTLEMWFEDPVAVTVLGQLVDSNAHGFRVTHDCKRMSPGLEVRYRFAGETGRARVIWTQILEGRRESGLVRLGAN